MKQSQQLQVKPAPTVTFTDFVSIPFPDIPVGGRVQSFRHEWEKITSDPAILKTISGFSIPLIEVMHQLKPPKTLTFSEEEMQAGDEQIEQLLAKGAIMECNSIDDGDFVSHVFLRPKHDSGHRLIIDLADFNDSVQYVCFKMETIIDIIAAIEPGMYMCVADLQDAYLVILIARWHWHLLKFQWHHWIFCFLVLPFGLACSPRIFSKVAKVPLTLVREQGHVCFMYIDDGFLAGRLVTECTAAVQCFLEMFVHLGFLLHPKKCMLIPSQQVNILGFIINSVTMTISISEEKKVEIHNLCVAAMADPIMSIRQLSRLIGKLISVLLALPLGQAHFHRLEKVKTAALIHSKGDFDVPCTLPAWVFPDSVWWTKNIFSASAPLR